MAEQNLTPDERFVHALESGGALYGVRLDEATTRNLLVYFRLVRRWNTRLHLVAPCTPEEFATRHVLESLAALPYIPQSATLVEVGSGAGLPSIPCLVARPDLRATLIDSSRKKAVFLREALAAVGASDRVEVVADRFENRPPPRADVLTCRALERFTEMLPRLFEWSADVGRLLLFGGTALGEEIEKQGLTPTEVRMPESERRYLFVVNRQG